MAYRRERIQEAQAEILPVFAWDLARPITEAETLFEPQEPKEPKWELNLTGLISWLEQKDPTEEYDWNDCSRCLVAQFLLESTGNRKTCSYERPCGGLKNYHYIGAGQCWETGFGRNPGKWTFGQALQRAKEVRDRGRPERADMLKYDYGRMEYRERAFFMSGRAW